MINANQGCRISGCSQGRNIMTENKDIFQPAINISQTVAYYTKIHDPKFYTPKKL